jgi:hypothetical protein
MGNLSALDDYIAMTCLKFDFGKNQPILILYQL